MRRLEQKFKIPARKSNCMFTFLNKRKSMRWCEENNLKIDLDKYALVENDKRCYIISKDLAKLDMAGLNIIHIGLDARKLVSQSPRK